MSKTFVAPATYLVIRNLAAGLTYAQTAALLGMKSSGTASTLVRRFCEARGQTPRELFADIAAGRVSLGVDESKVVVLATRAAMLVEGQKWAARKRGGGPCRAG